jgi:hypothetical protein
LAVTLVPACSAGGTSKVDASPTTSVEPSPPVSSSSGVSPSPVVSTSPAIPAGTYVLTAPITRDEALANGLRGLDVDENLGLFELVLEAGGTFALSQDPPEPVEFPFILGAYEWTPRGLVLTPSTFRGQVWILTALLEGDRVRFRVVRTIASFAKAEVRAGVTTIFETHPWALTD